MVSTSTQLRTTNGTTEGAGLSNERFLPNDWLFQAPRKNTWCENQSARGLFVCFFFFPTTAPFPSRSGACYFCAACFRDLRSLLSESLAQADQMTFPKLENGDNTAKEKKAITHNHYYWCWLSGKNSYLAQKKLSLRASDYWIGRSNSQLRETRRIEFFV